MNYTYCLNVCLVKKGGGESYTERLQKPDTFCLLQTRKLQILDLNSYAYFNNKTVEIFLEQINF